MSTERPRIHARQALKEAQAALRETEARKRRRDPFVWVVATVWYLGCLLAWFALTGNLSLSGLSDMIGGLWE